MENLLQFLQKNELWVYLILGLVGIFVLQKFIKAQEDWRGSVFGLEKESAQRRFRSSLAVLILVVLFAGAEFILVTFVYPSVPGAQPLLTPTVELLATPSPVVALAVEPSPTAESNALGIEEVTSSVDGCVPGQVEWTYPKSGDTIQGKVELRGTINLPNLGYYYYEYRQSSSEGNTWVPIAAGNQPINDQPFGGEGSGLWDTSQLVPGDYFLRLVVKDNVNNLYPPCEISIRVIAP